MLVRDLFGKKLNELTNEELKEYRRRIYEKRRKGVWETSYSRITYGRPVRKLSLEERREYNRLKKKESRERQKKGD